jgi:hypothetical protein
MKTKPEDKAKARPSRSAEKVTRVLNHAALVAGEAGELRLAEKVASQPGAVVLLHDWRKDCCRVEQPATTMARLGLD